MKENIVCSGALFYSTSTKRFLFLQRTDKKTQGLWGLVGGKSTETVRFYTWLAGGKAGQGHA